MSDYAIAVSKWETKIIRDLNRTFKAIQNHTSKGGTIRSKRGIELVDRYNDLKRNAQDEPKVWIAFCNSINAAFDHDGYDLFA